MDLYLLDKTLNRIDVIDDYTSLIWTDRYQQYGDFELVVPATSELIAKIQKDYYLQNPESEHIMIVQQLKIDSDVEEGNKITITGRSLESILDRRVIWGQKTLSGNFQNGVQTLLNECIIAPSNADRKIDNFIFEASTDEAITNLTISAQYTGDNLYDVICSVCSDRGVGFKVTLNSDKKFVFKLYAGTNRSYSQSKNPWVIFSPRFDNINASNYLESNLSLKNVALVGGEGEGAARRYTAVGNAVGMDRREMFTDARDISSDVGDGKTLTNDEYIAQLRQRGKEDLAENNEVVYFEGEADATQMFVYGKDFFNGDLVQVENEYGHKASARILEIITSDDEKGKTVYPTFSVESYDTLPKGYLRLSYIQSSGTQYFDTGYEPNQNTEVIMDVEVLSASNSPFFGARKTSAEASYAAWAISSTSVRSDYGSEQLSKTISDLPNRRLVVDKYVSCSFGGDLVKHSAATFQTPCSVCLLACNTNGSIGSNKLSAKLYSCKIYSNDVLIRDFVPCKNDEDVVGLYDLVDRKFYKNAGTGSFTVET